MGAGKSVPVAASFVGVGEGFDGLAVGLGVLVCVGLGVLVSVGLGVLVSVGLGVLVSVGLGVAVALGVLLLVGVTVTATLGVGVKVGVSGRGGKRSVWNSEMSSPGRQFASMISIPETP